MGIVDSRRDGRSSSGVRRSRAAYAWARKTGDHSHLRGVIVKVALFRPASSIGNDTGSTWGRKSPYFFTKAAIPTYSCRENTKSAAFMTVKRLIFIASRFEISIKSTDPLGGNPKSK
jgi:hypothetical protein